MLSVNQQNIDLGKLEFGKTHSFHYELTNTSPDPIEIVSVVVGCKACTKTTLDKHVLLPSQTTHLKTFYTPGSTGVTLRGISIIYKKNDVIQPELKLTFKSSVT